jgi:hypothetical protein
MIANALPDPLASEAEFIQLRKDFSHLGLRQLEPESRSGNYTAAQLGDHACDNARITNR